MTRLICGMTPLACTLRQKISAYPASETTPSWIRAPPESLIPITGQPYFTARSITLQIFSANTSLSEPPNTVKSCEKTKTLRPKIVPYPVTTASPYGRRSSIPKFDSRWRTKRSSSTNVPGSQSRSARSRASSLPAARCLSTAASVPAWAAISRCSRSQSSFSRVVSCITSGRLQSPDGPRPCDDLALRRAGRARKLLLLAVRPSHRRCRRGATRLARGRRGAPLLIRHGRGDDDHPRVRPARREDRAREGRVLRHVGADARPRALGGRARRVRPDGDAARCRHRLGRGTRQPGADDARLGRFARTPGARRLRRDVVDARLPARARRGGGHRAALGDEIPLRAPRCTARRDGDTRPGEDGAVARAPGPRRAPGGARCCRIAPARPRLDRRTHAAHNGDRDRGRAPARRTRASNARPISGLLGRDLVRRRRPP